MKSIKIIILSLVIIVLIGMTSFVYASSFNFTLNASTNSLKPGDTVNVGLGISNIDVGESGINTIEAVLEYDENVFEPVLSNSFAGLNNWSITYNGEEGENKGKIVAVIVQEGVKEEQLIGNLTLKVKEGVGDQTTKVTFKNIKTNDGTNEITEQDQVVTLDIKSPVPEKPVEPEQPEKPQVPEEPETNTINNENIIEDEDNLSDGKLPQTGTNAYLVSGIGILLIILGVIAYLEYKKMNDVK